MHRPWPLIVLVVAFVAFFAFFRWRGPRASPAPRPPAPSSIARVWAWFLEHEARLSAHVESGDLERMTTVVTEVSHQLQRVCAGLVAEVATDVDDGERPTLVVSANGESSLFPCADAVVEGAPALRHFTVVSLRQRRSPDWRLELDGRVLDAHHLRFRETGRSNGRIDLEVLVPGYTPAEERQVFQALFPLLDGLLGERDVESKLGAIGLAPLQAEAPLDGRLLTELPRLVDSAD